MSVFLTTLVFFASPYLSTSYVNTAFPLDYEAYHNETGFTDDCWVEDFFNNDICNGRGFCSTIYENGTAAQCQCFFGFSGDYCEVFLKGSACEETDCGLSGIQGECVMGSDNLATCYCYPGWEGDDCSEEVEGSELDLCTDVMCNNAGACVENSSEDRTGWICQCNIGYGGENCEIKLEGCTAPFLLDIFSRLIVESGDVMSASECAFSKPLIYSSFTANDDTDTYAFCICASLWVEYLNDDYNNMLRTCTMDDYRTLPFYEESMSYCPNCDDDQDAIMESLITTKSNVCYHFVYKRTDMPLHWRSLWKCGCVEDLGTLSATQTILTCPFQLHTSVDDYIAFENCASDKVCNWVEMYRYFEEDLAFIDLEASALCKDWMENWVFTTPVDGQRFEEMDDTFCPCLDALKSIGDDYDSILDCIPVTFHQLSMVRLYDQICYDKLMKNTDCLNSIGYVAVQLAEKNYTAATSCYSAIDLSTSLTALSGNLEGLMCDCLVPLYSGALTIRDYVSEAVACVGDEFAMNVCDCPDYTGTECYSIPSPYITNENVVNELQIYTITTSTWKIVALIEISLFCSFLILTYFMQKRKTISYTRSFI